MLTPSEWWHADPFDNWAWYFVGLFPILLLDYLLVAMFGGRARWFQLHTAANAAICVASWSEVVDVMREPAVAVLQPTTNAWGSILAFCLHLYHVFFFKLSVTDQYHHAISAFMCMPFSIMLRTKVLSLIYFQATGVAGGIDYAMLTLVKHGRMDKLLEKQYNAWLNAYIRAPLGAVSAFLTVVVARHGETAAQRQGATVLAIIVFANSCVFGKMAIENYVLTRERQRRVCLRCIHDPGGDPGGDQQAANGGVNARHTFTSALSSALVGKFHHLRMTTAGAASSATNQIVALSHRSRRALSQISARVASSE